jgi:hypothetical protein
MVGDGSLAFHEFVTRERVPLATVHDAVLEFLRGRKDAVLEGAQAVNAYVRESRMTQDVDIASTRAPELAAELSKFLKLRFRMAIRVRDIKEGVGFRIVQQRKVENRHLVDVRCVACLPPMRLVKKVQVLAPPELIPHKVISMVGRQRQPKGGNDKADLYRLLLMFPELKVEEGPVLKRLEALEADNEVMAAWKDLVVQDIQPEDEDDKFSR